MTKKPLERRIYKNAPIIEAALDLKFNPADGFAFAQLDVALRERYKQEYPKILKQVQNEFALECIGSPQLGPIASHEGLRFMSGDEKQIIQVMTDGFTFSRLKPYEQWESFRDESKRLLSIYQEIAQPKNITRVALRFINRFDFPTTSIEFSEYLNIFPRVPDAYTLNGLAMQVSLDQPDIKSSLVIIQAMMPPSKPRTVSLLIDFNLYSEELRSFENLWDFLEQLHLRKNEVFESSITEKTREIIS